MQHQQAARTVMQCAAATVVSFELPNRGSVAASALLPEASAAWKVNSRADLYSTPRCIFCCMTLAGVSGPSQVRVRSRQRCVHLSLVLIKLLLGLALVGLLASLHSFHSSCALLKLLLALVQQLLPT